MTENKYFRGKIYKLISNNTENVYYGSTIEEKLSNRLAGHRRKYKKWLNGTYCYVASFEVVEYEDCKIILVESYPCKTFYELTAREQYYIDNNICVNKIKANTGLCREAYKKNNRKDHVEEYKCICGAIIHPACQSDKQTHFNSKKHIKYIDENHAVDETSKT